MFFLVPLASITVQAIGGAILTGVTTGTAAAFSERKR